MVVLRCPARQWGDRRRGLLHQTECQPEGSPGSEEHRASGSGYHDHNWGDVPMQTLMHNWYWARASVGAYNVIASYITATAAYGYETQIVYMLARDGKIIADDDAKVTFEMDRV